MRRSFLAAIAVGLATVACSMNAQTGPKASLEASPTQGTAPLVVTFTGRSPAQMEGVALLEFGDGESDASLPTVRGFERKHTYRSPGTYTVLLKSGPHGGQRPAVLQTVASLTIVVR